MIEERSGDLIQLLGSPKDRINGFVMRREIKFACQLAPNVNNLSQKDGHWLSLGKTAEISLDERTRAKLTPVFTRLECPHDHP